MEQRIIQTIFALVAIVNSAMAQTLSVASVEAKAGEQTELVISASGMSDVTALQFNLALPEGVILDESAIMKGETVSDHTLSVQTMDNGNRLFVLYNMDLGQIGDGTLLHLPITAGQQAGNFSGSLNTIRTATTDAVSHNCPNANFNLSVKEPAAVYLDQSEVILKKKKTLTLTATVYPETLEDKSVTWESSDKTIATVSKDGVVTGVKSGVVTITCTSNATGAKATCTVTVATIALNKSEVVVRKKKSVTLKPTVYPTTLEDKSVTWKSSDETIATVSSSGKVTGVKSGFVTITCTSNATGLSTTCKVTVGTITLNKSSVTVDQGKTVTLKPTVYPTSLEDKSVKWKSSDKSVATVTSAGKVKGVKAGVATITCTSVATGLSATCTVTVPGIAFDPSEVVVRKKKTLTLTPIFYPETVEDKSVTWKTSDKTVATVSADGVVTGVKSGVVTITCTSKATGLSATCKVTVGTITLDQSEVIIRKKNTVTLTPTVYPTSLEDKSVTWESSDESVATVSSDGVVTGVKSGVVTITCTSNATGLSATCKVIVGTITLSKSSATIIVGNTVTLTPTVYPTTLEDQSVTWKSSNAKVAKVSSTGKVTAVKAGTATITCTSNATGLSTTCKITVKKKSASARTIDGEDAELTDIEMVEETPAAEEPFDVFNLVGHKVRQGVTSLDGLPAGVYIVKGKKVLKK